MSFTVGTLNVVHGICEPKPARYFPAGRLRWKMEESSFVRAFIRTTSGLRVFYVQENDGFWEPWSEIARSDSPDSSTSAISYHSHGAFLIALERHRQVTTESWTPEHDDEHVAGQLAHAARCYAGHGIGLIYGLDRQPRIPQEWPWGGEWWKPSLDPIRDLTKAGALIAAEIDRLTRQSRSGKEAL